MNAQCKLYDDAGKCLYECTIAAIEKGPSNGVRVTIKPFGTFVIAVSLEENSK